MSFKRFDRFNFDTRKNISISTILRGQEYRSRLEARWAEFFFQLGILFSYESREMWGYVPDFTLCLVDDRLAIRDRKVRTGWVECGLFGEVKPGAPTHYRESPEHLFGRNIYVEIKPTIQSREECVRKFLRHAQHIGLITFIGNPPGEMSFVETRSWHWELRPVFGACDMCGVISLLSKCQCGEIIDPKHETILKAATIASELNFTDISDDFKEFR